MEQALLTRDDLSKRWKVDYRTIVSYEASGIITRNPNLPVPRYNLEEIQKIEGIKENPLSPIERRKILKENEELKEKIRVLTEQLRKISLIGIESTNILSNLI